MVDSESDTTKASEGATKLLNESGIDVMITSHTADTVNPVSAACERAGIPCISVDTPADAWAANGPYTYSYHAGFNTENELSCFADAWDAIDSNKTVGILAANDAEGIEMSGAIAEFAESRGYTVVDPGRFTSGTSDYTSIINDLKNAECDTTSFYEKVKETAKANDTRVYLVSGAIGGFDAVSYTHLDVYKRQGMICPVRSKVRNNGNTDTSINVPSQCRIGRTCPHFYP